jgi:hypothetical protein
MVENRATAPSIAGACDAVRKLARRRGLRKTADVQIRPATLRTRASLRHKDHCMPTEPLHNSYRTWAELIEAARTDEEAWLYLVISAPWATHWLERPVAD